MSSHPLTDEVAALASALAAGPLEVAQLDMGPCESPISSIEASLGLSPAISLALTRVPPVVLADRPLDIECSVVDLVPGSNASEPVARSISTYAQLSVALESNGGPRTIWCSQSSAPLQFQRRMDRPRSHAPCIMGRCLVSYFVVPYICGTTSIKWLDACESESGLQSRPGSCGGSVCCCQGQYRTGAASRFGCWRVDR